MRNRKKIKICSWVPQRLTSAHKGKILSLLPLSKGHLGFRSSGHAVGFEMVLMKKSRGDSAVMNKASRGLTSWCLGKEY